jgi:hypothetical protein
MIDRNKNKLVFVPRRQGKRGFLAMHFDAAFWPKLGAQLDPTLQIRHSRLSDQHLCNRPPFPQASCVLRHALSRCSA